MEMPENREEMDSTVTFFLLDQNQKNALFVRPGHPAMLGPRVPKENLDLLVMKAKEDLKDKQEWQGRLANLDPLVKPAKQDHRDQKAKKEVSLTWICQLDRQGPQVSLVQKETLELRATTEKKLSQVLLEWKGPQGRKDRMERRVNKVLKVVRVNLEHQGNAHIAHQPELLPAIKAAKMIHGEFKNILFIYEYLINNLKSMFI